MFCLLVCSSGGPQGRGAAPGGEDVQGGMWVACGQRQPGHSPSVFGLSSTQEITDGSAGRNWPGGWRCLHHHCCLRVEWAAASRGFAGTSDVQTEGWTHSGKNLVWGGLCTVRPGRVYSPFPPRVAANLPCVFIFLRVCSIMSDSFAAPWTVAHQASLSMGFSQQEY